QESWTGVEETVKTKSETAYGQIEKQMETVSTLLKTSKPDATQLTSELQALGQSLTSAATAK
ncbi:MAG: hypothetical protein ACKO5Q_08065, partial [Microcystaceae cyanobacterium]